MSKAVLRLIVACAASAAALCVTACAEESTGQNAVDLQQTSSIQRGPSGLPLPRYVSLKSAKVNARTGPGLAYSVEWKYMKAGLPVEIMQEFDNWRRIRDSEGAEGWVNQSLLSGRRTAIVAPWQAGKVPHLNLLYSPSGSAVTVAKIEPGVIGRIHSCNGKWCEMSFGSHHGWMAQNMLWGAYRDEQIED